jgi:hypothetical protein
MTRTALLTVLALSAVACAAEQADTKANAPAGPKTEAQQTANLVHFDLGVISAAPPAITGKITSEVLTGVELAARPAVMECLVDPKNRGADKKTKVVIDASLGDAGVDHKVSGENLTPAGTACIEGALKRFTQASAALTAKNAVGPVKSQIAVEHTVGQSPAVVSGGNDASEIAGAIRLALPSWGECFADWKSAPPRMLKAQIKVNKPNPAAATTTPAEVKFDPTTDAAAGKVASCLEGKLKALSVKAPSTEFVSLPFPFRFVHSGISDALPDASPELAFTQLDLMRARRAAEAAVAFGERKAASGAYEDLVKRFKAKEKPEVTVAALKDGCAALLAADDKLIGAVEKQASTEESTNKFATEQKAKDASWGDAANAAAAKLAEAQKDLATFKEVRKQDEGACPKVKF